jgi:hypothetical protein
LIFACMSAAAPGRAFFAPRNPIQFVGTRRIVRESSAAMRHTCGMKHACWFFCAAVFSLLLAARAAAQDVRFSQTLSAADRSTCGITRLTSDQLAVLDALVRRDTEKLAAKTNAADSVRAAFSERLTADERRNAGIATLMEAELPQLDALVARHQSAKLARTLLAPPMIAARSYRDRVTPRETTPERKIHGEFSLSYGWGSGGYNEKTGSMLLNYDDPQGRYSVTVGYSESHVKGPAVYRDPFYDVPRGPLLEPSPRP